MRDCIAHEGVVPRWVEQIAANIHEQGVMKNPIIVTKPVRRTQGAGRHIVIDGMHRFAAFQRLEIPDIVVFEIDYDAPEIRLEGWDALAFRPFATHAFLRSAAAACGRGYRVTTVPDVASAQRALDLRRACIAATDRAGACALLTSTARVTVDRLVRVSQVIDQQLDAGGFKPVYVADSLALADFRKTRANGLIIRPHYTKREILERTMAQRLFPRKSTRHLIPGRPLRVDVNLAILRAKTSLAVKNQLLDEHLRWCYATDRLRYYPEAVFVFAD